MQKIHWRTLQEAQNSEEYSRFQRVTEPVFNYQTGRQENFNRSDEDYFRDERVRKVNENRAKLLGFL
jgi:hypothetical protein